jgi:hypothetical protein
MRYQSTVFGQLLKAIPRGWFDGEARRHRQGRRKRELSEWGHLVAMVLAQVSGARSLRDLERVIGHHPGVLSHLGLGRVRRSTLADANAGRPAALFEAVAAKLAAGLPRRGLGREALRLIDATRIFAGKNVAAWAGGGVKLHVALDPLAERPVWFAVTGERVNDITAAKAMPVEGGASYVFDKGYYDFGFWAQLDAAGCRFVTRLKKNAAIRPVSERPVAADGSLLFDRIVLLAERLSGQRRNPYQKPVRLVGVRLQTGAELVLLTNDLAAPASTVAALYKARWQVELFFKWIKQNLRLARFLGTSRNAVTIQIMAALIAFLLMRSAILRNAATVSLKALASLMPATAFARRPLATILGPPPQPPQQTQQNAQLNLAWS